MFPVIPDKKYTQAPRHVELKTFLSPMSLASQTSTHLSPYSESTMFNYPRLTAPRDIQIPESQSQSPNVKVILFFFLFFLNFVLRMLLLTNLLLLLSFIDLYA